MASSTKQAVTVHLQVINEEESGESHATRDLILEAPSYSVRIGRGSRSGSKDLYPNDNNAWFDSRVMSREHAILKADLGSKTLTIEDAGSMHGTYVDDVKLSKFQPKLIYNGDYIVFGAEVNRGHDTFPALEINIFYSFDSEEDIRRVIRSDDRSCVSGSRNSFSVPDYDSEDDYSDMEVKVIPAGRDEAIPKSDVSNEAIVVSDDDDTPYEPWNRTYCNTFQAAQKATHELNKQTKTTPADVIMWSGCSDGDAVSHQNTPNAISMASASQVLVDETSTPSQQLDVQPSMTVEPTEKAVAVVIDSSASLADDQSESDYGDDISADLFDEDFDEHYQGRQQPDTSSFSSQSPILTSLPSKIELAAHQSSVQEALKPISPSSSLTTTSAPRPPSPSDAAMPKVKATSGVIFPPVPERQYQNAGVTSVTVPSSKYAGYVQIPRDSSYVRSYGYTCGQDVQGVQDTYPQPYYPLDVYSPYYEAPSLDWSWGASQIPSKAAVSTRKTLEPEPAPVPAPASPFVTIKTAPRVAIRDLVEEPENIEESSQKGVGNLYTKVDSTLYRQAEMSTLMGTKRKADQISDGDRLVSTREILPECSLSVNQHDAQITLANDVEFHSDSLKPIRMVDSVLPSSLAADAQVQHQATGERPIKKARSNLYKQAAGAAGWIAVGAVGAVAALVALPADFFV